MPRILVPEKVSPDGLALLQAHYVVDNPLGLTKSALLEEIHAYDALIVWSETRVDAALLAAATKLKVVARAGVGVDNIDVPAATARGVIVVNSPAGNILAAAEHTVALLLATARNVGRGDAGVKEGRWERSRLVGVEVGGKTLGVIGLGKVGMKVARMAGGLGMRVVAVDPYASLEIAREAGIEMVADLGVLLPRVDFLTIHTPLLASTLDLLGEDEFRAMKTTARVLNVARGGVYNEAALLKALDEGWIAGAGLDVFTSEPPEPDSVAAKLSQHQKVVATPHLGASTVEAQENVSMDVCTQVLEVLRGGMPTSAVNAPLILPEEYRQLQPFVKLIEKMGGLYTQHFASGRGRGIGGRTFELTYRGELAGMSKTRPLFAALIKGLVSPISDARGTDVNIVNATLIAKDKGIAVKEVHAREETPKIPFGSLVSLRSYQDDDAHPEQQVEGYVSGKNVYISRLDRFTGAFVPEGTLILLQNYDEPGKIGGVGTVLGQNGVNIQSMQVASLDVETRRERARTAVDALAGADGGASESGSEQRGENEALMILRVAGVVEDGVVEALRRTPGILNVSVVKL